MQPYVCKRWMASIKEFQQTWLLKHEQERVHQIAGIPEEVNPVIGHHVGKLHLSPNQLMAAAWVCFHVARQKRKRIFFSRMLSQVSLYLGSVRANCNKQIKCKLQINLQDWACKGSLERWSKPNLLRLSGTKDAGKGPPLAAVDTKGLNGLGVQWAFWPIFQGLYSCKSSWPWNAEIRPELFHWSEPGLFNKLQQFFLDVGVQIVRGRGCHADFCATIKSY